MPIPTSALIESVAKGCALDPALVARFWRTLREAGLVPSGRSGRSGGEASVEPAQAATLLVALLGSETALGCVTAVAKIRALKGPRVFVAITRLRDGPNLIVSELLIAPQGATLEDALASLINLERGPTPWHTGSFGPISVSTCRSKLWGRIEVNSRIHQGHLPTDSVEPPYPLAFVFSDEVQAPTDSAENLHPMYSPGPFYRTTSIGVGALFPVAKCFGQIIENDFERLAFPCFETITYSRRDLERGPDVS